MLGTLLEGIRDGFDVDVLNSTAVITEMHKPMDTEDGLPAKNVPPTVKTPALSAAANKPPQLAEGLVSVTKISKGAKATPSARDMSKSIVPTTLSKTPVADNKEATRVDIQSDKEGSLDPEEIVEPDNYDALSFTSSIFSDGNDSFDARNVTLPNGRLNVDKLMGWTLPTVNLSRVLERSACKSPNTRNKILRLMDAQGGRSNPQHSTPAVGNISTIRPSRKKKSTSAGYTAEYSEKMSVKESIRKMLEEMKD